MFQRLFGKWKIWQVFALVALVAGVVAVTATIAVAGTVRECPASIATRSHAAPSAAGPDASTCRLALSHVGHSQPRGE